VYVQISKAFCDPHRRRVGLVECLCELPQALSHTRALAQSQSLSSVCQLSLLAQALPHTQTRAQSPIARAQAEASQSGICLITPPVSPSESATSVGAPSGVRVVARVVARVIAHVGPPNGGGCCGRFCLSACPPNACLWPDPNRFSAPHSSSACASSRCPAAGLPCTRSKRRTRCPNMR
jgi:hypothetical protein